MKKSWIDIKVGEIECTGCVTDIEKVLLNLEGILEARVSYKEEIISVVYDPDIINEKIIFSAIVGMGLKARAC